MLPGRLLYIIGALVLLTVSCAKTPPKTDETSPRRLPLALVVEDVISGYIRGQVMRNPVGLAVGYRGKLFVCDAGNNRLVRFNDSLVPELDAGGLGSLEGLFNKPGYITVDNGLNVYVSDVVNRRICRLDKDLYYVDAISLIDYDDPLKYGEPSGLAVTDYGEVWMCDYEKSRIAVFSNVGQFDRFVGDFGYSGGQLYHPEKIIRDPSGNFVVCDGDNIRLVVYDDLGNFMREIKNGSLRYPVSVLYEGENAFWVLDGVTGEIYLIDGAGKMLFESGAIIPGAEESLRNPSDMVRLKDGRILVSDTGNNRLLVCRVLYENR
jgi:DNA-binding beta-propeller fold protein YncE